MTRCAPNATLSELQNAKHGTRPLSGRKTSGILIPQISKSSGGPKDELSPFDPHEPMGAQPAF